jgi:hexosaminidase
LWNIQGFIATGQSLNSTGALTTVWNDDGEGLFNMDWYGVLFGAVAAWQPGQSSIADYQDAYGPAFHLDPSGKIDAAEKELMAAQGDLVDAKTGMTSDQLFWLDPWSAEGQAVRPKLCPLRTICASTPSRPWFCWPMRAATIPKLAEPDALAAMDLGARRLDLIGLKFQLAQEIPAAYAQAVAQQHDKAQSNATYNLLSEISGMNGRCQDLRDAYSAMKSEYSQVWLGENRSYWLNNVTVRYDLEIERWQRAATSLRRPSTTGRTARTCLRPQRWICPRPSASGTRKVHVNPGRAELPQSRLNQNDYRHEDFSPHPRGRCKLDACSSAPRKAPSRRPAH